MIPKSRRLPGPSAQIRCIPRGTRENTSHNATLLASPGATANFRSIWQTGEQGVGSTEPGGHDPAFRSPFLSIRNALKDWRQVVDERSKRNESKTSDIFEVSCWGIYASILWYRSLRAYAFI